MIPNPITSDILTLRHGFFTREGGVSTGLYNSLNCGMGSDDDPKAVTKNRNLIVDALQGQQLSTVYQVHSATVAEAPVDRNMKADAQVTNQKGVVLGVLTADCTPVLFEDAKAGVIGAAHAGWKGAISGVLESTVSAMEGLGAARAHIKAAIGPTITQANYEVGQEFLERFESENPDFLTYFAQSARPDKYQFDLPRFCLDRLRSLDVQADWTGHCTYADEKRFFSYRRMTHRGEGDYGRQLSAIVL